MNIGEAMREYRQARRPRVPSNKSPQKNTSYNRDSWIARGWKLYRRPDGCFGNFNRNSHEKNWRRFFFHHANAIYHLFFFVKGFLLSSLMSYFYAVCLAGKVSLQRLSGSKTTWRIMCAQSISLGVNGIVSSSANCRTHLRCEKTYKKRYRKNISVDNWWSV